MKIELNDADVLFIYGNFKKRLSEIDKIAVTPNFPFDKTTIKNEKAPYLSIIDKIAEQVPNLKQMDKYL